MDRICLTLDISDAAINIDYGRKGFATRGKAEEGRISYEEGIAKAVSAFQEALLKYFIQQILLYLLFVLEIFE